MVASYFPDYMAKFSWKNVDNDLITWQIEREPQSFSTDKKRKKEKISISAFIGGRSPYNLIISRIIRI